PTAFAAHEDKAPPDFLIERDQSMLCEVQVLETLPGRHCLQRTVERVAPGVIGADETVAAIAACAIGKTRAAMAADIVETAHHAICAAQRQELFAQDVERVIVAGVTDIVHVTDEMPGLGEELLPLGVEETGILINTGRQALALGRPDCPPGERHEVCAAECRAKPS